MFIVIMFVLCLILAVYALVFSGEIGELSCFLCLVALLIYIIASTLL